MWFNVKSGCGLMWHTISFLCPVTVWCIPSSSQLSAVSCGHLKSWTTRSTLVLTEWTSEYVTEETKGSTDSPVERRATLCSAQHYTRS